MNLNNMKILLIVDFLNWAWGIKAKALKKYLPQYDIDIVTIKNLPKTNVKRYDVIHSFSWTDTTLAGHRKLSTCGISGHVFLARYQEAKSKIKMFSAATTTSKKLYALAKKHNLNKVIYNTPNGVDETFFYPKINKKKNDKFVIGWVGKETTGGFNKVPIDFKGYGHVLQPLMRKLKNRKNIELRFVKNDFRNSISREAMIDFYQKLDLFICTSYREGTPNPVFEASACGIPVISTDVGCIPELITNNHNGLIIPSYDNKNDIVEKNIINLFYKNIILLKENNDLTRQMGEHNRETIERDWKWETRAKQWIPVFENHKRSRNA